MLPVEYGTPVASVLPLFWFVLTFSPNAAKPYPEDKDEEFTDREESDEALFTPAPKSEATIRADLIKNNIIPDFFALPPKFEAFITYYNGTMPDMGNTLRPDQVKFEPHTVTYKYEPDSLYTVVLTGLDEPSRESPTKREFLHWIVGNIPDDSCLAGDQLVEYYPILPKKHTGRHRYLYLVYKQTGNIEFKEPPLTNRNDWGRANWSSKKFAEKYKLGEPYAVNFFFCEYISAAVTTTPESDKTVEP